MNRQASTGSGTCCYRSLVPLETTDCAALPPKPAGTATSNKLIPCDAREQRVGRHQNEVSVNHIAQKFGISESGVRRISTSHQTPGVVCDRSSDTAASNTAASNNFPTSGSDSTASNNSSLLLKEEEGLDADSGIGSQETQTMGCGSSVAGSQGMNYLNGSYSVHSTPELSQPITVRGGTPPLGAEGNSLLPSPRQQQQQQQQQEPVINSLLFDTPQLDPERIGPVPEKFNLLTDRRGRSRRSLNQRYPRALMLPPILNCPLATMMEQNCNHDNRHVENVTAARLKPLYGECLWGFPYGRAPEAGCYETALSKDENPITMDPANPIAKTLLADLGYSTQVFFNACCKPPRLLDGQKVAQNLPFSLQPSSLSDSTRQFYLVMIAISCDPSTIFAAIPEGSGPMIAMTGLSGQTLQKKIFSPITLSQYWSLLMDFAVEKLACCENFISASPPSSPCLVCHPFVRNPTPPLSPCSPMPPMGAGPYSSPRPSATSEQPPAKKRCGVGGGGSGDGGGENHPLVMLQRTTSSTSTTAATPASLSSMVSVTSSSSSSTSGSLSIPGQTDPQGAFVLKNFCLAPTHPPTVPRMMFIFSSHKGGGGLVPFPGQAPVLSPPTNPPNIHHWPRNLPYPSPHGLPSSPPIQFQMSQSHGSSSHFTDQLASPSSLLAPTSHSRGKDPSSHVVQSLPGMMQSNGQNSSLSISSPLAVTSRVLPSKGGPLSQYAAEWKSLPSSPEVLTTSSNEEIQDLGQSTEEERERGRGEEPEEASTNLNLVVPSTGSPAEWTTEEVKCFVMKVADSRSSQVFQDQEVDGQAMLLLTTDVMVNMMNIKIGPALKLMKFINALKEKFGS